MEVIGRGQAGQFTEQRIESRRRTGKPRMANNVGRKLSIALQNTAARRIELQSLGKDRCIFRVTGMDEHSQRIDGRQVGRLHLSP